MQKTKDAQDLETKKQALLTLTKEFCQKYLDDDYERLCEKMIHKMSRKRIVPFASGKIESWAAAIVYTIGHFNFLFDKSFKPYMKGEDICKLFGVSVSNVSAKSTQIRHLFNMMTPYFQEEFTTEYLKKRNPLIKMKGGFIIFSDE